MIINIFIIPEGNIVMIINIFIVPEGKNECWFDQDRGFSVHEASLMKS